MDGWRGKVQFIIEVKDGADESFGDQFVEGVVPEAPTVRVISSSILSFPQSRESYQSTPQNYDEK